MTERPEPQKDYATPQERLAAQDWSGVAGKAVEGIQPGWVLAFVVIKGSQR